MVAPVVLLVGALLFALLAPSDRCCRPPTDFVLVAPLLASTSTSRRITFDQPSPALRGREFLVQPQPHALTGLHGLRRMRVGGSRGDWKASPAATTTRTGWRAIGRWYIIGISFLNQLI